MVRFSVEDDCVVNASAKDVYAVLADYENGHPHIMPPKFFDGMRVLKGTGTGEGTRIEACFNVYGQKETLVMDISEPEPGRVLQEIDTKAKNITQFIVEPIDDGRCKVTIRTKVMKSEGIMSFFDTMLTTFVLKRIFDEELKMLDQFMQTKKEASA